MRKICAMVGVTYTEFLSWFDCGEIRICSSRVVFLEPTPEGAPDRENPIVPILLERIPQLYLGDQDSILLIQLKPLDMGIESYEKSIVDLHTIYLPMGSIQRVIPLTERASRILKPRMEKLGIDISIAYFEEEVDKRWFHFKVRRDLRGGDALVQALFEDGLGIISETLKKAVKGGILELDFPEFSKKDAPEKNITWISEAFKYTRYEPYNYGELNYLLDAGSVMGELLKSQNKDDQVLNPLRDISIKAMKNNDKKASLEEFLKDSEWIQAIRKIEHELMDTTSAGFDSLVLFLRWKYKFKNRQQKVDFNELAEESSEFRGFISIENRVSAVWILGCYVGFGNVVPIVYASDHEMFPFYSKTEPRVATKISRTEKTNEEEKDLPGKGGKASDVTSSTDDTEELVAVKEKVAKKEAAKETTADKSSATDDEEADEEAKEIAKADAKEQEDQTASESKTAKVAKTSVPEDDDKKEATADKSSATDGDEADEEAKEIAGKTFTGKGIDPKEKTKGDKSKITKKNAKIIADKLRTKKTGLKSKGQGNFFEKN